MGWQDDALSEIEGLSVRLIERYGWAPSASREVKFIDLYCSMRRGSEDRHVLRVRYQADWQTVGRREQFVNPEDYSVSGTAWWPVGVDAIKSQNNPPAICMLGFWGFHSVLHSADGRSPLERSLTEILRDLQTVLRRAR
jgi:hypothetical protein